VVNTRLGTATSIKMDNPASHPNLNAVYVVMVIAAAAILVVYDNLCVL